MLSKKRKMRQARAMFKMTQIPRNDNFAEQLLDEIALMELRDITRPRDAKISLCQQARPNSRTSSPGNRGTKPSPDMSMDRQVFEAEPAPRYVVAREASCPDAPWKTQIVKKSKMRPVSKFVPFNFNGEPHA